jgi:uncharacterized protein (UPF0332 family)
VNDTNKKKNAKIELKKGSDARLAAQNLFEDGLYGDSISRIYYAAFHFVTSLLFTVGLEARSHQGLLKLFDQHFVKTKIFPPELSKILRRAKKLREESDYRHTFVFTKEETADELEQIGMLLDRLEKHLKEKGIGL